MAPSRAAAVPTPAAASATTTTSFLLANLHCPSCVSTIKSVLHDSGGSPGLVKWVSPNIVTSVVTVEHEPIIPVQLMLKALEDNGFEVCGITTSAGDISELDMAMDRFPSGAEAGSSSGSPGTYCPQPIPSATSALTRWFMPSRSSENQQEKARIHLQNCEHCRASEDSIPSEIQHLEKTSHVYVIPDKNTNSRSRSEVTPASFIAVEGADSVSSQPRWRATVAIGGMTCSACAKMITEGLSKRDWISDVSVNLLGNSATIELTDRNKADDLIQEIEDLGYEATLDSVSEIIQRKRQLSDQWRATLAIGGMTCASCVNHITEAVKKREWVQDITINLLSNSATVEFTGQKNADKLVKAIVEMGFEASIDTVSSLNDEVPEKLQRTVEIKIDGLYCDHCPARVVNSLAGFRRQLDVVSPPTRARPIVKLTYVADAPSFTVRHILAAIDACDAGFTASIYHPPTLEERSKMIQRQHQRQILWRVIFAGIVCIPSFVIGIAYMSLVPHEQSQFLMKPWTSGINRAQISLFIMATPVYFFAADLFHRRAFKEIRTLWRRGSNVPFLQRFYKFGSMNTLMSLGTTIAYVSSVSQMIAAAVNKPSTISDSSFYFDSVVFLTFFLLLGRLIESYSKSRTGDAVEMLAKLRPTTATLVENYGSEKEQDIVVKADLLDFGDIVRITHGSSPPSDGLVVDGESNFDESSLTGESRLVKKAPGDEVFSGTVNKGNSLLVRITGVAGQSLLDQIVNVVREGQTKRAPIEQIADHMTSYFVPAIVFVAIITWITWLSLGLSGRIPEHFMKHVTSGGWVAFSLQFAISVFVVACPCGLALAAPTAIFVGGGIAANHGILAKGGGEAFEKASRIDCVVFDKTGTLTEGGEPSITDSEIYTEIEEQKTAVLAALKAVEESSSHPIAKAIVAFCLAGLDDAPKAAIEHLEEVPGKGMKATYQAALLEQSFEMIVGNESFMQDFSAAISSQAAASLQKWKEEAKSVALVATKPLDPPDSSAWTLVAALSISDPIRPEAKRIIRALQARGTRVWMLSGDNPITAAAVAHQLDIPADQVIAGVLPAGKADQIKYLQSTVKASKDKGSEATATRAMIAMVGDGINDSPALATADVGIAIGSGSDVAISSADFVLVKSDLEAVLTLLSLSATVFRRIKFNFGWAVVYNVLAIPVAAGVFYPITTSDGQHIKLDPVWASLAMALSSISVVLSSLALRWGVLGYREKKLSAE
ncbi:E1-E2 ATPase-domain-containing protein [Podospora australis]|uniref:E1-E2 ATPase-domain-containing protein n=1 Tax=Podospora australis TaxID=1536484 RepID=A0AAN6WZ79_9PEZI|nr:E1-E2 ATPase-domain-containing protein [Podospora australis]